MKKYLFLLLIGASYLKSSAGDYSQPLQAVNGGKIKLETIVDFIHNGGNTKVFGKFYSQSSKQTVSVYVSHAVYVAYLHKLLAEKKVKYPLHYPANITLDQVLEKLVPVEGSFFKNPWYYNTGVNIKTGQIEHLPEYSFAKSLPSTLRNGNNIQYYSYMPNADQSFVDPWFKDNCANEPDSDIPQYAKLDDEIEQPQKEYANLPCRMGRIEMGKYDIEKGITHGRFSADGRYHYLNRNGSWSELINGEWVEIICPEQPETVIERKTVYKKTIIDTVFVKEYVQNTQTVYTFEQPISYHQQNYCNNGYANQNASYSRSNNFFVSAHYEPDRPQERIIYRNRPQPRQRRQEMTDWGNSKSFDSGNQMSEQNSNWGNSYSMDSGNQRNNYNTNNYNTNNNDNNHSFDRSGYVNGVNERVGQ